MGCPSCGHGDIGEIGFSSVASGANFHYCRRCEHRWWTSPTGEMELSQVLKAASVFAKA